MADIHGSPGDAPQMPQAGAGPAPVPYSGAGQSAAHYEVPAISFGAPGGDVLAGVSGNGVQEAGYAHDLNAGLVTPYYGGDIAPIQVHGDADAGGRDDVAATVAGSVHAAEARYSEHEADTHAQGSVIGDLMDLAPVDSNASVATWGPYTPQQPPSGSFT